MAAVMRGSFSVRPVALRQIHALEARSDCTFPRHSHGDFGIGLIVRGAQKSWSGRGWVEAQQGNLITCNPGEVHDGMPIGGPRQWQMLYMAPSAVAAAVTDIREGGSPEFEFTAPVMADARLPGVFAAAYDALTRPWTDAVRAEERMVLLLARLLRPRAAPQLSPGPSAHAATRGPS